MQENYTTQAQTVKQNKKGMNFGGSEMSNKDETSGSKHKHQPNNLSDVSNKSSIMGDYGGTHTMHNSN
jgi:hypothetical protein